MYTSPNPLPEGDRRRLAEDLGARLSDGIDLHGQIKTAHWNIKGALFASLHPLLETFAVSLAAHNDVIAERAVTLGGLVSGSARHVAVTSRLTDFPPETTRDLELARAVADRIEAWLAGMRSTRKLAQELGDDDTFDLLTGAITEFEKHAWFLRATTAG